MRFVERGSNIGFRFSVCGLRFSVFGLRFIGFWPRTPHAAHRTPKNAFTLVELLIVTAMLSIISLAIYSTFNNGIKIWQRINRSLPEEGLGIFLDKFSLDLKNTYKFTGLEFSGDRNRLEFMTLVNSPGLQKRTVGQVIYSYDSQNKILNREQRDYSQIYNDREGLANKVLTDIKSLKFRYYFYDGQRKKYLWLDEWSQETLPLAVRIEFEVGKEIGTNKVTKTVSIPVSS